MGVVVFVVAVVVLLTGWWAWRPADGGGGGRSWPSIGAGPGRPARSGHDPARWADRRDLRPLVVKAPTPGRLTLGLARRRLVAADVGHSLLVVGPTQSFKTTGLAVPALLEWQGPVLAASVKGDLVRDTAAWRRQQGRAWIYDPTASTYPDTAHWSPLTAVVTWTSARRVADGLVEAGRTAAGAVRR